MSDDLTLDSLDHPTATFIAYRKDSGEPIVVDRRTYDAATMSRTPVWMKTAAWCALRSRET